MHLDSSEPACLVHHSRNKIPIYTENLQKRHLLKLI